MYAVSEMIPILHAAAHLAYAKSARLYLETMTQLPEIMTEAQFRTFGGPLRMVILQSEGKMSFRLETFRIRQLNSFS